MLLPQTKEREYRFKLALRMGLPIFALIVALVSHTLIENYATLDSAFYIESIILLVFSIYFILYLIYRGFDVKITDDVSKTFTREYLFKYLKKKLKSKETYTLILISIDNLNDINTQYGIKNGDRVLEEVSHWIATYLKSQKIENFPLGHIKGGDFILGLEGSKSEYITVLDLMCLKSSELKVDDIEIKISGAISDSSYSQDLNYIVENLFEIQEETKTAKTKFQAQEINPNELESFVINAINKRSLTLMTQNIFEGDKIAFKECFVKLKTSHGKPLYPKTYAKVINKLGLSVDYDMMILEQLIIACDKKDENTYAINISPTSLRNEKFLIFAKELLKDVKIKIMFVLSEQEYYSHTSRYNSILASLKKNGVLIAIDKIASLHTSFLYLRELDIDLIRFDTYYSYESKIKQNKSIIDGFNLMAHEKGIKSWIKNIENEETYSLAKGMNIDYTQGKFLSLMEEFYDS